MQIFAILSISYSIILATLVLIADLGLTKNARIKVTRKWSMVFGYLGGIILAFLGFYLMTIEILDLLS